MREIKFRIWDIDERKFVVNKIDRLGCGDTKKCMSERVDFENNSVEINADERYTFSEYTGLEDKIGDEIYEGDIITLHDSKYKVIFNSEGARFVLKDLFFEIGIPFKNNNNKEMEVIGNIYENPELMEEVR